MAVSFSDIVELAKAGYKPSDVKELLELSKLSSVPEVSETEKTPEVITENKTETDSNKSSVFESIAE